MVWLGGRVREKTGRLMEDQRNRLRLQFSAQSLTFQGPGVPSPPWGSVLSGVKRGDEVHQAASREAQLEEVPHGANLCIRKETRGPERLPGAQPVTLSTMLPVFCLSVQAPSWKLSSPRADGSHRGPLALDSGAGWGTAPTVAWWLMRADGRKPAQTYRRISRLNRKGFFYRSLQCRLDSQDRAECPPRHS